MVWNGVVGFMGSTNFTTKTITLSKPNVLHHGAAEAEDTIRHEIAHALAGPGFGHGPEWKAIARSIGARPEPAFEDTGVTLREALAPWVGTCPAGHVSGYRFFRKPRKRYSCPTCNPRGWSADHIITYTKEARA
jgi:predicted SprT family Zn-dependent metalloprotease